MLCTYIYRMLYYVSVPCAILYNYITCNFHNGKTLFYSFCEKKKINLILAQQRREHSIHKHTNIYTHTLCKALLNDAEIKKFEFAACFLSVKLLPSTVKSKHNNNNRKKDIHNFFIGKSILHSFASTSTIYIFSLKLNSLYFFHPCIFFFLGVFPFCTFFLFQSRYKFRL